MTDAQKLADEYEAGMQKCVASGYEEYGPDFQKRQQLIIKALRAYAAATAPQALAATPGGEYEELANEIKRSDGLFCRVPGIGTMSLGATKTEMVIAALRAQPASPLPRAVSQEALDWATAEIENVEAYKSENPDWQNHTRPARDVIAPASPLRGREPENPLRAYTIEQLQFELAIRETWKAASTPEQPAAEPVMGRDDGWTFAKELSDALLKVRPLGGSELFVTRNGQYYADPIYCGMMIEELRADRDREIKARIRLERSKSPTAPEPELPAARPMGWS